nr:nucleotide-binding alpha-beta plait domain-containing protein [Tanacetum cinerariifolium]
MNVRARILARHTWNVVAAMVGIESIREWQKFMTADCTKCSICQSNMHLKNIHQIGYDHKIHNYYNVYGGRNRQYPYYRASVGATNGGMITLAGASDVAAAFYPYLNMAEGGHGLEVYLFRQECPLMEQGSIDELIDPLLGRKFGCLIIRIWIRFINWLISETHIDTMPTISIVKRTSTPRAPRIPRHVEELSDKKDHTNCDLIAIGFGYKIVRLWHVRGR